MKQNRLAGLTGLAIAFAFVLGPLSAQSNPTDKSDFRFVQLSDIHWGFSGAATNPNSLTTLSQTIALINKLNPPPDFIVCTGDLTHTTDDPAERRKRMVGLLEQMKALTVRDIRYLPGEHDAGLDSGAAFHENFGPSYYTFDHKGVHFVVLDNTSDPTASIGEKQFQWLGKDLASQNPVSARIVVLTHRPLFDLYPDWDWATRDGAKAIDLLSAYQDVPVFYGHIHQINLHQAGPLTLYAARGLMYPLPAPGSLPKKAPMPWDSTQPYRGLGFRVIDVKTNPPAYTLTEYAATEDIPVVSITAKKFEYTPNHITLKKGQPVIIELTSEDRLHGFNCPALKIRSDVNPGLISQIRLTPDKAGTFPFHCDNYCGDGHSDMTGEITVEP